MKPRKALILTDKPERVRTSQHLADLLNACQSRPLRPGLYNVLVRHDFWCRLLANRGSCSCRPDIEITEAG